MSCKLEELTESTKAKFAKLSNIPDIILSEKLKNSLIPIFKHAWNTNNCYFNDCTFVIETSKEHYSFMPNQYFYFALELSDLAIVLKKSFDIFDTFFRDDISKKIINTLQAPVKKGQRISKEEVEAALLKSNPNASKLFTQIGNDEKDNFCFLVGNLSESKKFGSLDGDSLRGTSDLYGSYLLNVAPLTTAESGTFGDFMYTLVSYPDIFSNLSSDIQKSDKKETKKNETIIELPVAVKECARQIILKIYEYDKFERITNLFNINKTIKIDASDLYEENVLSGVFLTPDSDQFDNSVRTFLQDEYYFNYKDIPVHCRLTTQWVGFGADGDDNRSNCNWIRALRDIVNLHYQGIFKIENDGAKAYLICYPQTDDSKFTLIYKTQLQNNKPRNRIIFGAPGTGKSFELNKQAKDLIGSTTQEGIEVPNPDYYERITFHPNFSYAQFVGTYKPISKENKTSEDIIYEFIPGGFTKILVKALKNARDEETIKPYLLIIEEINRANVAAVFSDIFQLLDRNTDGFSEYEIETSEDLRKYLSKKSILGGKPEDYRKIRIPNNLFIWATMNSADQGVFPMDTAFKRRWEFEYIGIDDNEDKVKDYEIPICKNGAVSQKVKWNELRKAVNDKLISLGVNEDKLLGPFFLSKSVLELAMSKDMDFVKLFESKVLMYLFEDAAKMKVRQLFNLDSGKYIYSEVCKKFEKDGLDVFILESTVTHLDLKEETQNE